MESPVVEGRGFNGVSRGGGERSLPWWRGEDLMESPVVEGRGFNGVFRGGGERI